MSDSFDFLKEYMEKESEDRKMREAEMQIRYTERKKLKYEHRCRIEAASMKVCAAVDAAFAQQDTPTKPEDIVALAAALNHVSTALHAAENYAESQPYNMGLSIGYCG